jgi:multicomponent Na+:H+ antiporter subunit C
MTVELLLARYPYILIAILIGIGLYGMTIKRNLLKKVIGMTIFQTAIYLLFIQGATKRGATIPVRSPELGSADPALYINPLPQVIVLTAIVVGVAITGVALSLLLVAYRRYGTLDEEELLARMRESA